MLRPFFYFYGAKWMHAKKYPSPIYDTIVEPFAGGAGYALRYHEKRVVLVERDPLISALWRWLICVSPEEILSIPLVEAEDSLDDKKFSGIAPEAKSLVGFRIVVATSAPAKRPGAWMKRKLANPVYSEHNRVAWGNIFWCEKVRERLAKQVECIRHWTLIEGDWSETPDIEATWFVDPPYQGPGKHYKYHTVDYNKLAHFCKDVWKGQIIVCEQDGADWLPFTALAEVKSTKGTSKEVVWSK